MSFICILCACLCTLNQSVSQSINTLSPGSMSISRAIESQRFYHTLASLFHCVWDGFMEEEWNNEEVQWNSGESQININHVQFHHFLFHTTWHFASIFHVLKVPIFHRALRPERNQVTYCIYEKKTKEQVYIYGRFPISIFIFPIAYDNNKAEAFTLACGT